MTNRALILTALLAGSNAFAGVEPFPSVAVTEGLGVSLIDSVMTLVAFLPVLLRLSGSVKELPFIGEVPHALVVVAVLWSAFGTAFLAIVGIKLPGLEFRNQRVEAAYRKELVYGEDHPERAEPRTVRELFAAVQAKLAERTARTTTSSTRRCASLLAGMIRDDRGPACASGLHRGQVPAAHRSPAGITGASQYDGWSGPRCRVTVSPSASRPTGSSWRKRVGSPSSHERIVSRIRWPASNTMLVGITSTSTATGSPGSNMVG
mgnify:CR=1 FL=1